MILETQPTKFSLTFHTLHMHATLILLDLNTTFGTILGVKSYPFLTLIDRLVLRQPLLQHITITGFMGIFRTFETVTMTAWTINIVLSHRGVLTSYCTIRGRTPLGGLALIHI